MEIKTDFYLGDCKDVLKDLPENSIVLHLATECNNKNHSAAFPEGLPQWFIRLFTKHGDTVLDPFMGSGTTNFVAQCMDRNSIGIEINSEYYEMVKKTSQPRKLVLFDSRENYGKDENYQRYTIR